MLPFHTLVKAEWKKIIDDAIAQEEGDLRFIKLEQIAAEINNLMDKVSSANSVLMEYINKRVSELDAQSKTYRQQLIELSATTSTPRHDMIELAERLDRWEDLDYDDRRVVVDELIQKVAVTDQTVDIQWRY